MDDPPYSQPLIEEFCVKLIKEIGEARAIEAITLTNNATETVWGTDAIECLICVVFPAGRVNSGGMRLALCRSRTDDVAIVGSTHIQEFKQHFSQFGVIR